MHTKTHQEGRQSENTAIAHSGVAGIEKAYRGAAAQAGGARAGSIPAGDCRLVANIRQDLHHRLKLVAADRRTTIGELIEGMIAQCL